MIPGVKRGTRQPPRVVLYGPPGVGKSTFGADAEAPIIVTTEDGVDNLPVDQFPAPKTWPELLDNLHKVADLDHDYQTVVLDTLNGAVELASQHICKNLYGGQWTAKGGNGGFLAWAQGWKATSEELRAMLIPLDACRVKGMTVVLLAHSGLHNVKHPSDGDYTKFAPDVDKVVWARVAKWSDIVLRADYETVILKGTGPKGRVTSSSTRYMTCAGSAAEDAKCRVGYELPDELPLDYGEFKRALGSPSSTLEEARALWPLLTEEEANRTLAWLGGKLEEASLTKVRQIVDRLKAKKAALDAVESEDK